MNGRATKKEVSMQEKRTFTIHPQMIYHLIEAQAGTLGKAFLEYIQNSIDAQASEVAITLTEQGFEVQDDGRGFTVIDEIAEFFETFGFPHSEDDHRIYGKFGMGRAQMWSFADTRWRTGVFEMYVDIKNRGLDYDLAKNLDPVTGCHISGTFYEPLLPSDLDGTIRELTDLALYAQIPVILNGQRINRDPTAEKWDVVTDDAYIRLKETGDLKVYNLGVLVRGYPTHQFGCGGLVVARKSLQVNFARNDVLVAKCPVWKRLRTYLQASSTERTTRKARLTDAEQENVCNQVRLGVLPFAEALHLKLITDTCGRQWPIDKIDRLGWDVQLVVAPEEGSQIAERIHQRKLAFVLSPKTLSRFNVDTVEALVAQFMALGKAAANGDSSYIRHRLSYFCHNTKVGRFEDFAGLFSGNHEVLKDSELKPQEKWALRALEKHQRTLLLGLWHTLQDRKTEKRILRGGVSDSAQAWTDGQRYIVLNRDMLKKVTQGLEGCVTVGGILVHEYLHDNDNSGSHLHDMEFYENFHEVLLNTDHDCVGKFAREVLKTYTALVRENGKKVNKSLVRDEDNLVSNERFAALEK